MKKAHRARVDADNRCAPHKVLKTDFIKSKLATPPGLRLMEGGVVSVEDLWQTMRHPISTTNLSKNHNLATKDDHQKLTSFFDEVRT